MAPESQTDAHAIDSRAKGLELTPIIPESSMNAHLNDSIHYKKMDF